MRTIPGAHLYEERCLGHCLSSDLGLARVCCLTAWIPRVLRLPLLLLTPHGAFPRDSGLNFLFSLSLAIFLGGVFYLQDFTIHYYADVFEGPSSMIPCQPRMKFKLLAVAHRSLQSHHLLPLTKQRFFFFSERAGLPLNYGPFHPFLRMPGLPSHSQIRMYRQTPVSVEAMLRCVFNE